MLDGTTYARLADLPAGDGPHSVAHNPANGRVCVTSYWSWTVMMYDAETLTVLGELTGFAEPAHLAVNPNVGSDGHLLLVTSSSDGGLNQFLLIPGG